MPRRRRGGRESKPKTVEEPRQASTNWRNSPSAQAIAEKIARGGKKYLEDNFERVMIDSYELTEEPEFADLYFDDDKTAMANERFAKKYIKQLEAAKVEGEDEYHQVFDQVRIEIIDEIARPPFRKEVLRRLEQLTNRLAGASDARKLEIAFVLGSMLRMKKLPWGICGLVLAVYERTIERGRRELEEEREVMGEVLDLFGPERDLEKTLSNLQDPELAGVLTEKLKARPELRQRLERQVDKMVEGFEQALWKGETRLDLFTQEELLLPFHRMQAKIEAENVDLATADPQKTAQDLIQYMRDSLVEVLTPDRLQEIKRSLERVSQQWQREKNKWAMPLQAEIGWLDDYSVEESRFFMAAYAGQIRRQLGSRKSDAPQSGRSTPSKSRGLVSRARRLLGKDKPEES